MTVGYFNHIINAYLLSYVFDVSQGTKSKDASIWLYRLRSLQIRSLQVAETFPPWAVGQNIDCNIPL